MKPGVKGISSQSIEIDNKKITVLSDHTALLTTSGISKIQLVDGNEISIKFYWSFVFERFDDAWKVIYSHQSRGK